jgi:RNA polymerase sigma-70 factor (ECF subfamily)
MLTAAKLDDPAEFFHINYPKLYKFIFIRTGAPHGDIEDILQESLVAAWEGWKDFGKKSSMETWIVAIVKHKISDYGRARARSENHAGLAARRAIAQQETVPIPEEILNTVEMRQAVEDALSKLDSDYARLLTLRYLEDWPMGRMATLLGESEVAVESRLARARKAFRLLLSGGSDVV